MENKKNYIVREDDFSLTAEEVEKFDLINFDPDGSEFDPERGEEYLSAVRELRDKIAEEGFLRVERP